MGTKMKIRFKDIAQNRNEILFQQGGYCAICLIEPKVPCLDHNHSAPGNIRGVLCRGCNLYLGKIQNNYKRYGITDVTSWLRQCATYIDQHEHEPLDLIHPTYLTPNERKEKTRSKAKAKAKSRASAKASTTTGSSP